MFKRVNFSRRILAGALALVLCLGCMGATSASAAEVETMSTSSTGTGNTVMPRAGVETLPYGQWYDVGTFTFTDANITPTKTVPGRYLTLAIGFKKASIDAGLGDIKLKIQIRDANNNPITDYLDYGTAGELPHFCQDIIDLGWAGREIHIVFDACSAGTSNGNYRSAEIMYFRTYVDNG